MSLAAFFRPVLVFAPRVERDEIVEQLDITRLKADIDRALVNGRAIDLDRLSLSRRVGRHARKLLRLVDSGACAGGAKISFDKGEDRLLEPRLVAGIHLAAVGTVEVLAQDHGEVRPPFENAVVDGHRACHPAFAAALSTLQTEQPNIV